MDVSQISSSVLQSIQPQPRHHRRSIPDMVTKMESGIDDALKAGQLSGTQATQMKKVLDSITEALKADPTGAAPKVSAEDMKAMRSELRDVGKQLYAATHQGDTGDASGSKSASAGQLFAEFLDALKQAMEGQNAQGAKKSDHHRSFADRISEMQSGIDDAVKAGQLTQDQADEMKKQLAAISDELKKAQGDGTQPISDDDKKKIGKELHEVGKQLHAATNPDGGEGQASQSQGVNANDTFAALLDTLKNATAGNGNNGSSALDLFMSQIQTGTQYNQQGGTIVTASITQSMFSVIA